MKEKLIIRTLKETDWKSVSSIYQEGIATGNASFDLSPPNWVEWNSGHLKECRIVAEINHKVVGWAALSPISSRCVYGGVAEVSVYVSTQFAGQKIGRRLLDKLILESENNGIWTLQAGIFPENIASLRIHERLGFRKVGYREKIGQMKGIWRDTTLLEKRSEKVGVKLIS